MEDREVSVQNGKQDNEEEREEEIMAIEVDIYMVFSVCPPPNRSTATGGHISDGGFGWVLPSFPFFSSILFGFDHCLPWDGFLQKRFQSDNGPLKCIQHTELNIDPFGQIIHTGVRILNPFEAEKLAFMAVSHVSPFNRIQ
jgi:hypothetical protein